MITNLAQGNPARTVFRFSLPILGSMLFQQLYNIMDSVIAGRYAGEDALAAIGASYPITMIFMAIAVGCNLGTTVVISQRFGAGDNKGVRDAAVTAFVSCFVISAAMTVIGVTLSGAMTDMLGTPAEIRGQAVTYLSIYTGGMIFLFMYNISTGIFTALGDSKTPFLFLVLSSVSNVVLDIIMVKPLGIAGVAWATFIAQGGCGVLAMAVLIFRMKSLPGSGGRFSFEMLRSIIRLSVPSILQQSFISVGNMFVQSVGNSFGGSVIAGYSAAIKINTLCIMSLTALGNALSSYTAQNIGAKDIPRVRSGVRASAVMGILLAAALSVISMLFSSQLIGLFTEEKTAEVIDSGRMFLMIVSPFYSVICCKLLSDGVIRGAGAMKFFMISTFIDLILRTALAYVFKQTVGTAWSIWLSWPIGWIIGTVFAVAFYVKGVWIPEHLKNSQAI